LPVFPGKIRLPIASDRVQANGISRHALLGGVHCPGGSSPLSVDNGVREFGRALQERRIHRLVNLPSYNGTKTLFLGMLTVMRWNDQTA
jgi:hypothetical protein